MRTAYLGLGSNLDDRFGNMCRAVRAISRGSVGKIDAISPVYETVPVGGPPQGPYLNAVLALTTDVDAEALLTECHAVESYLGRERHQRWGPRTIDIDILLYGDLMLDDESLTIPHPRLAERGFVLYPLADIAADVVHPVLAVRIAVLRERVGHDGIEQRGDLRLDTCIARKNVKDEQ